MNGGGNAPVDEMYGTLIDLTRRSHFLLAPFIIISNAWENRNLLMNFIRRDVKLQYKNSFAGYLWSLLEPLALTVIYYFFFTVIAARPDEAYAFWVIIGVIIWGFFSKSLNATVGTLVNARGTIKQIYFPREIFPISRTLSNLYMAGFSLIVMIPFMIAFDSEFNSNFAFIPLGFALATLLALGVGMLLAPLNAMFSDVSHMVRIVMRAGFFLSPVMWTLEMAAEGSRGQYLDYILLNPMVVPITMIRGGFTGAGFSIEPFFLWYSVAFCIGSFIIGSMVFYRFEARAVKLL